MNTTHLLKASVEVGCRIVPRVPREELLLIGVSVRQGNQASVRRDVCEGIYNVGEPARRDVSGLEVGAVDIPAPATTVSFNNPAHGRESCDY